MTSLLSRTPVTKKFVPLGYSSVSLGIDGLPYLHSPDRSLLPCEDSGPGNRMPDFLVIVAKVAEMTVVMSTEEDILMLDLSIIYEDLGTVGMDLEFSKY